MSMVQNNIEIIYAKHKHKFDNNGHISIVTKEHRKECLDHANELGITPLEYGNAMCSCWENHKDHIKPIKKKSKVNK